MLAVVAAQTALDCGMKVIACIGESLEVREANKTLEVSNYNSCSNSEVEVEVGSAPSMCVRSIQPPVDTTWSPRAAPTIVHYM